MISEFFVNRPVVAWAIALVVLLIGSVRIAQVPVAQWPQIAPPTVSIGITYPGASAETIERTTVTPVLQSLYGLDGLEYVSSTSNSDGSATVAITFVQGTDPDVATSQVLSRIQAVNSLIPSAVSQQGLRLSKATKSLTISACLSSRDGSIPEAELGETMATRVQDPVTRLPGVGDYQPFYFEEGMRIWLDAHRLDSFGINATEVLSALAAQNEEEPLGQLGGLPASSNTQFSSYVSGISRLSSAREFGDIIVKAQEDGSVVTMRMLGDVELAPAAYEPFGMIDNRPVACLGLKPSPSANQLDMAAAVHGEMLALSSWFPRNIEIFYPVDTSPTVKASIRDVLITLWVAIVLVIVVIFGFLGSLRATAIPALAIPLVLISSLAMMSLFDYSINTLTMLASVLAIGLLVDDTIVVVENVERVMSEESLSVRDATLVSMKQIGGALVGIAVTLSVVFLPIAFFPGAAGIVYRQFSVVLVTSVTLSAIVAMTLVPAFCVTILRPVAHRRASLRRGFLMKCARSTERFYARAVIWSLRHTGIALATYLLLLACGAFMFERLDQGFMPDEDQGLVFVQVTLPPGSSAARSAAVMRKVTDYFLRFERDNVQSVFTEVGYSFGGQAQNAAYAAVNLKSFDDRRRREQSAGAIAARASEALGATVDASIAVVVPPPVWDLGNASGFDLEFENRGELDVAGFAAAREQLLRDLRHDPRLKGVYFNGLPEAPVFELHVDRAKAASQYVSISDVDTELAAATGTVDGGIFNLHGRVKHILLQGGTGSRMIPSDLSSWRIRNARGQMVSLASFVTGRWKTGQARIDTFNGFEAFEILGQGATNVGSERAMQVVNDHVAKVGLGTTGEWTGMSFEQNRASGSSVKVFAISMITVLLVLAAIYNSWPLALAVFPIIPLGAIGAVLLTSARGLAADIYFQLGVLTTMGLGGKNAILIVEFARPLLAKGVTPGSAALRASRARLRPILMTSAAFGLGTVSLALSSGAGAGSRIAIGTSVIGGVITATLFVLIMAPVFLVLVIDASKAVSGWKQRSR